eukprot:scpid75625/ scgid12778/ Magnesium-dependent phosphatase 1
MCARLSFVSRSRSLRLGPVGSVATTYRTNTRNWLRSMALPKLVALDLDDTVWHPDMIDLASANGGPPFTAVGDGTRLLNDNFGHQVKLLGAAGNVVHEIKHDRRWTQQDTKLVWVSMCDEPEWAQLALGKFMATPWAGSTAERAEGEDSHSSCTPAAARSDDDAPPLNAQTGVPMGTLADASYIYDSSSKIRHFQQVQEEFQIPFEEMMFFDNMRYHVQDVARIGVHCVHCPDGLTKEKWLQGLDEYAARKET